MTLIFVLAIGLLAVTGAVAMRQRRLSSMRVNKVSGRPGMFNGLRGRAAALLTTRRPTHLLPLADAGGTRPDLQRAQSLGIPAETVVDDGPLGLAVIALATDSAGYPQQDVYYVQRNVVALARGLSAAGVGQRAAALSLSAVMTSPLGRSKDAADALCKGVKTANRLVRSVSQREPKHSDIATTLDVVFVAFDGNHPSLHFAHVGNSSIWLHRVSSMSVELLTEPHTINGGGPLLRAVGVSADVIPDIGQQRVDAGDRLFLTTASLRFAFTPSIMNAIVMAHSESPLHDCAAALVDAAGSNAAPERVTIVAAEVASPALFLA